MKKSFIISDEHIEFLREYMPNIDDLVSGDEGDFELELTDVICDTMVDDEPTELTYKLEEIYDTVYADNNGL